MMKKLMPSRRSKRLRNDCKTPLIENNNNNIQDGRVEACDGYGNPSAQNTFNTHKEEHLQSAGELQELAKLLGLAADTTSEDGSCCAMPTSRQENQLNVVRLIQRYMHQHFPKPPAELGNLQQHLFEVQTAVHSELARLAPWFKSKELMGCLLDCYRRQTFDHLHRLLQNISTSQNSFVLMKWVLTTYLSQELLGAASPQEVDHIKHVDLLLFTEWVIKAKEKLLENVQKEVRECLEKILQIERSQESCDSEEAFVGLHVDTIQCIEAMSRHAQEISKTLSDHVQDVCFQELVVFVGRYVTEQTEILRKQTEKAEPQMILFLKTLKNCEALKQHVQTKNKDIKLSLLKDIVQTLEKMEDLTLKLLLDIVADFTKGHLKKYFKTENKQFFLLIEEVKIRFSKQLCCQVVQERVMDEVYKLITDLYVKHLVRSNRSKLRSGWSSNVGQTVTQDAKLLHAIISDMAPGVQQWNLMLLKIGEMLECSDTEALKIDVASMQQKSTTKSCRKDLERLLRWKGLSKREVREVLEALPEHQPRRRFFHKLFCSCGS